MNLDLAHDHTHSIGAEEYFVRDVLEDPFEMLWQRIKDLQNADIWCEPACSYPATEIDGPILEAEATGVLQFGAVHCLTFPW